MVAVAVLPPDPSTKLSPTANVPVVDSSVIARIATALTNTSVYAGV